MSGLYDQLKKYGKSDYYPFHMPGHKRNNENGFFSEIYSCDITEIDGFDNLHQAEGILADAQQRAAKLYGAEETFFLVNGSTCGILSAISAVADRGKKIIIARNCHKAVYHGIILNHLEAEYLYPELIEDFGISAGITKEQVRTKIEEILQKENVQDQDAKNLIAAIMITSPTYDGILSDVRGIVKVAHKYNIPVIVDQAHGAHFGFHKELPQNAIHEGADLVIHSTHKTLPAPTQTALLHRKSALIGSEQIKKYLKIYQSSSPSYLLMAGIDTAIQYVDEKGEASLERMLGFRKKMMADGQELRNISIYPTEGKKLTHTQEPGRILISVKGTDYSGKKLYDELRLRYHLQMEMCTDSYCIALLSMMDKEEGFRRLGNALKEIDREIHRKAGETICYQQYEPEILYTAAEAFHREVELIDVKDAEGRAAGEYVNLYPPGIPLLVPGEKVDKQIIEMIHKLQKNGMNVQGVIEKKEGFGIPCLTENKIKDRCTWVN